jgi:hypothetical protein
MRKVPTPPQANTKSPPKPLRDVRPKPAAPVRQGSKTNRSPAG